MTSQSDLRKFEQQASSAEWDSQIGTGSARAVPKFDYIASKYSSDKYDVHGLSYPEDLADSPTYGNNKVIFYINVSVDSRVVKSGSEVTVVDGVQRNERGQLVGQNVSTGQAVAGAAGAGTFAGGLAGTIAGVSGGSTAQGKIAGGLIKGLGGAAVGGAAGAASVGAIAMNANNAEVPPGQEKEPTFSRPQKRLKAAIALYVPNQLNARYSSSWGEEDTMEFSAFARGGEELGRALSGDTKRTGGLATEILGALALSKGPQAGALSVGSGLAANPKKEQAFKNVDFRTFTFDYQFAPKSETEAQNVLNIIRAFKYHMHPEFKSKDAFLYVYPSEFDIVYYKNNEENLNIHRHTSCVLTEMNVNYTPNGVFSTFPNGMPTQITMTLTFKELMLLSKELIEKYT